MNKILVPVDFSETTQSACNYALNLVSGPSEIILLHAYFDQVVATDSGFPAGVETETMINEQLLHDIKLRAKKDLIEIKSSMAELADSRELKDVNIQIVLEGGEPENEILRVAGEYRPDFIVMGSSAYNKRGFLESSMAKRIMNLADIPVFAIPYTDKYLWPGEIAYATEFCDEDAAMIRKIFAMLEFANPRISCLHILQKDGFEEANDKMNGLRAEFNNEDWEGRIQFFILEETELKEDIASFLRAHDISLMAFIPHRRSIIKGIFTHKLTKKELFQFNLPLLAIK